MKSLPCSITAAVAPALIRPNHDVEVFRRSSSWMLESFLQRHREVIRAKIALAVRQAQTESDGGNQSISSELKTQSSKRKYGARTQAAQDRNQQRSQDDSDSDDNNGSRPPKALRTDINSDEPRERFACPYHQRNPERYRDTPICVGPGWRSISKVK